MIKLLTQGESFLNVINGSYLKICFVVCPLLILFCLGVFLDESALKSERERRMLAKKPESFWFNDRQTEDYLADHILFRDKFLDFYFEIGMGFDLNTPGALIGKEKWLFQNHFGNAWNLHNTQSYQNKQLLTGDEIKKIAENVQKMQQWCQENNILLYVLFPPDKHRIYARFMPSYILREDRASLVKQVIEALPSDIAVIPLEDELTELSYQSKEPIYYLTESHWSEEGVFQVYLLLMNRIKQNIKELSILSKNDFNLTKTNLVFSPYMVSHQIPMTRGNLYFAGMKGYDKPIYTRYHFKDEQNVKSTREKQFRFSDYEKGNPDRVYIIGDSYGSYLHAFLSASFSHVRAYRFNESSKKWGIFWDERKKEMLEDKTNVLILEISDLKLKELLRGF